MAGFLGFYRIQQCIAPRFPGACSVLLQQLWLELGEFRTGSQYRTRLKGEGMDETSLSLRRPDCYRVYLYLRHGDICVALGPNNRMHALRAFYCHEKQAARRIFSFLRAAYFYALSKSVSVRRLYAFRIPSFFSNLHKAADNSRISPC